MDDFDSSNPEHIKLREREFQSRDGIRLAGLREIMRTQQGRAYMWHLLSVTHVFAISCPPFDVGVYFREGERNVGLQIFTEVQKNHPQEYLLMVQEANTPLPPPKKKGE